MIKKYSSPAGRFTINVKKDGKSIPLVFDQYDPDEKRRFIHVSDPDIQEQMEKSKDFNVYFRCDGVLSMDNAVIPAMLPLIEPVIEAKSNPIEKKDLMDAKRWLNSIGVPYNKMKNKDVVVGLAKEQGYDLSFETDKK